MGVAETALGEVPDQNLMQMQATAARAALIEAGLTLKDVDGVFCTGFWGWSPSLIMAEYLGIQPRYSDGTNLGGCSFESYIVHAAAAIEQGLCDVALITYANQQRTLTLRNLAARADHLTHQWVAPWGMPTPVGAYAMAAMRHMHQYGTKPEELAEIAVAARQWAAMNPKAWARDPITVAHVLSSPMISDPLHRLDCCLITDGGGAVVLTSLERARSCRQRPVRVLGYGEAHASNEVLSIPDITVTPAKQSGERAFAMAGIRPHEVDVAQLYDSFTITVLLQLEDLGFCGRGEGGAFVSGGRIAPGGDFPLNTSGGGLSYCHPGMFGILLLVEAVRQLRGECDERQVPCARLAVASGMGGRLSAASTVVLGIE